jgi:hypothetical protein
MSLADYQEQWDQAEDMLVELCGRYNLKNDMSLDEFYAEYYHCLSNSEQAEVERILNLY